MGNDLRAIEYANKQVVIWVKNQGFDDFELFKSANAADYASALSKFVDDWYELFDNGE